MTAVLVELPDPGDFLGPAADRPNADDISARGPLSPDGALEPIESLELIQSSNRDVGGLMLTEHPAVDLKTFETNTQSVSHRASRPLSALGDQQARDALWG